MFTSRTVNELLRVCFWLISKAIAWSRNTMSYLSKSKNLKRVCGITGSWCTVVIIFWRYFSSSCLLVSRNLTSLMSLFAGSSSLWSASSFCREVCSSTKLLYLCETFGVKNYSGEYNLNDFGTYSPFLVVPAIDLDEKVLNTIFCSVWRNGNFRIGCVEIKTGHRSKAQPNQINKAALNIPRPLNFWTGTIQWRWRKSTFSRIPHSQFRIYNRSKTQKFQKSYLHSLKCSSPSSPS